ncbi:MAG: hypothetical protein QOE92_911, partial [Chloroflexota bacterium]|nr:hypothetical protein [Chloroflexota bacterium]
MNALTLLKNDHKKVEDLFKRYEKLGDRAEKSKAALVKEMIRELSVHANIEETVFYPETRERVKEVEDEVLEGLEEHHVAKWTLYELSKMKPSDERFDPKVKVMMESVRHHVEEEETAIFPPVREKLTPRELDEIGARLEKARK